MGIENIDILGLQVKEKVGAKALLNQTFVYEISENYKGIFTIKRGLPTYPTAQFSNRYSRNNSVFTIVSFKTPEAGTGGCTRMANRGL